MYGVFDCDGLLLLFDLFDFFDDDIDRDGDLDFDFLLFDFCDFLDFNDERDMFKTL